VEYCEPGEAARGPGGEYTSRARRPRRGCQGAMANGAGSAAGELPTQVKGPDPDRLVMRVVVGGTGPSVLD
jgi:hypothetical protein